MCFSSKSSSLLRNRGKRKRKKKKNIVRNMYYINSDYGGPNEMMVGGY
jgi:hypothetical protein